VSELTAYNLAMASQAKVLEQHVPASRKETNPDSLPVERAKLRHEKSTLQV
jgi:hypothetical protein